MAVKITQQDKKEIFRLLDQFKQTKSVNESAEIVKQFKEKVSEIKAKT